MNADQYKERLLAQERALSMRIDREMAGARDAGDGAVRDSGDESVTEESEEEQFAEADTDQTLLNQVRAALTRIDNGTFGLCVVDREPIEAKRLEATPWTAYCLRHQQEREGA